MPRTVLITGITGFAGSHLAERFATGGVAGAAPAFMPRLKKEVAVRAFATPRRAARILVSSRNDDLGAVGAALLIP